MIKWIIIVIVLSPIMTLSQNQIGIKGGINFSNLTPLEYTYGSINSHAGVFYSIKQEGKWTIQPEILVSRNKFYSEDFGNISLSYVTIPFMVKYFVYPKVNIQAGAQYGVLLNASGTNPNNLPFLEIINTRDFSGILGIEYEFLKHLHIEGRVIPEVSRLFWKEGIPSYRKVTFQLSLSIPLSTLKLKEALDVRDWEELQEN